MSINKVLVTGGLGFIGSAVVRHLLNETSVTVLNLDCETYAATSGSVENVVTNLDAPKRYRHIRCDISDAEQVEKVFVELEPDAVIHLAAESHVDRSIDEPDVFLQTNVNGTFHLLQASRRRQSLQPFFRFVHVSTDEVFGSLGPEDPPFTEESRYEPRSPYATSKASSDHLVRSWHSTYDLATIITNCSNNYGPFQFPEKLIPLMILKGRKGERLPIYGSGNQVRDWLYVEDHARGIVKALWEGTPGETYAFGGRSELKNIDVVQNICSLLDEVLPERQHHELVESVADRPGHDARYAIDPAKAEQHLDWSSTLSFESGLEKTVNWYLSNEWWWGPILKRPYVGSRLGNG